MAPPPHWDVALAQQFPGQGPHPPTPLLRGMGYAPASPAGPGRKVSSPGSPPPVMLRCPTMQQSKHCTFAFEVSQYMLQHYNIFSTTNTLSSFLPLDHHVELRCRLQIKCINHWTTCVTINYIGFEVYTLSKLWWYSEQFACQC